MIYSDWGSTDIKVSRLGFGTTRFNRNDLNDEAGLNRCVDLVLHAIARGINYFDVAPTYSYGHAEKILGRAFAQSKKTIRVAAKSGLIIDKTAEDIFKRINSSIETLNVDRINFYHLWSVMDLKQYETIMKPGGLYEGVMRAKDAGLVEHICISLHCKPIDVLKIIADGYFEGITISMNALNYEQWLPVLRAASEKNIAIATMNSLAGGIIPRYAQLFESIDDSNDKVTVKALRFLSSFKELTVMLSGMQTVEEIDENCRAFNEEVNRRTNFHLETKEAMCSGCNYCAPCTVGIPISACMQAYNHKVLVESSGQTVDEKELVNELFIRMRANGVVFPDIKKCITCRRCEPRCTQKINISERMHWLERAAEKYNYTKAAMRSRLSDIEKQLDGIERIGIYPSCHYADRLLTLWNNPALEARFEYFNSSSARWGERFRGKSVHGPSDIESMGIGAILITHYSLQNGIYDDLIKKLPSSIKIIKLHEDNDINWFIREPGR